MSVVEFGEGNGLVDDHKEEEKHCKEESLKLVEDAEMQQSLASESDSDSEDGVAERFSKAVLRGDGKYLVHGQIFFCREVLEEAVLDYALKSGRNIKQYINGKSRIGYKCVGGNCEWRVYCAFKSKCDDWEVTVFNDRHSCVPNGECEMLTVPVIARFFVDKLREEPEYYMPMKIEEVIMEKWKITVSEHQCKAARNMALEWIEREYDLQFERLRDYGAEILESNPNTTVDIETLTNGEGLDVFNRFYVCFDCLRRSWKETCRPLISVESCFLRSKMKWQLLVALGRDADNDIYPIAWAVVQDENTVNWLWFLKKLKADLGLEGGAGYVLISDSPKGLIKAVEQELPHIEHRMCVRHIYANLKANGKKSDMKPLVWRLALSYNEVEYKANLDRLLVYDRGVYEDVMKSNPATWCRAFYKVGSHCEDVENNSTESFNATLAKAREKPLVPMLEMIATISMVRIYECSLKTVEHPGVSTPYVQDLLALELPGASECKVYSDTNMMFQVLESGCFYQVNLVSRTCSCRKWDIRGIPCQHGYAVVLSEKYDVESFVSNYFTTELWRRTYTEGITPTRGAKFWPRGTGNPVHKPPSPSQVGRKKKSNQQKRKTGINESPTKKKKRIMHCGICGAANHNIRFHRKQGGQAEITQASHGEITQVSQSDITQASQGQIIQTSD